MNRAASLIALCIVAVALAGCPEKKGEPDAGAVAEKAPAALERADAGAAGLILPSPTGDAGAAPAGGAVAEAEQIFATRCTVCHGPLGKGDGPGSAGLDPKPRNFTDPSWQTSVTDEYLEKIILYGGLAVGKSAAMPPNTDLASKPEVIAALRAHVRSLKGK